jgi:ubiquinone biosynthesis protein
LNRLAVDLAGLMSDLPALMRLLLLRVRQGSVSAKIELQGLERIGADIRWAATRVAVAIVTAASALGLAPRLFDYGPMVLGVPLPLWVGLGVIAGGLFWRVVPRGR